MKLALINRDRLMHLGAPIVEELDNLIARIVGGWRIEHKDDGSHGDVTADTLTLRDGGVISFETMAVDESDEGPGTANQGLRVLLDGEPIAIIGEFTVSPALASNQIGLYLRPVAASYRPNANQGWMLATGTDGFGDYVGLVDTAVKNVVLKLHRNPTTGAVTNYYWAPDAADQVDAALVNLGRDASGKRWTNAYFDGQVKAVTSFLVGTGAAGSGVLLKQSGGLLSFRAGDDSADTDIMALNVTAGAYYAGGQTDADVRIRKNGTGTLALRLGAEGGYANLEAATVAVQGVVTVPDGSAAAPTLRAASEASGLYLVGAGQLGVSLGGVAAALFGSPAGTLGYFLAINAGAFGTGAHGGSGAIFGRNTSGSGAASWLMLEERDGTDQIFWVESGLLRMGSARPTEDNATVSHTSGGVVGDQTSLRSAKFIINERTDYANALKTILRTPIFDFTYRDGRYHGETFTSTTTDDSPVFGKDHGRAFNELNAFGYLVNAVKELALQNERLTARVEALETRLTWRMSLVEFARNLFTFFTRRPRP